MPRRRGRAETGDAGRFDNKPCSTPDDGTQYFFQFLERAASAAVEQMFLEAAGDRRRCRAVEVERKQARQVDSITSHVQLLTMGRSTFSSFSSARAMRDETVPIETPRTSAISSYCRSST